MIKIKKLEKIIFNKTLSKYKIQIIKKKLKINPIPPVYGVGYK